MSKSYSNHSSMWVLETSQRGIIGPFQTKNGAIDWVEENTIGLRQADQDEYFHWMDRDDCTYTMDTMHKDWIGETILG